MSETAPPSDAALLKAVNDTYGVIARTGVDSDHANRVAQAFGYTNEQLQSIPSGASMGLSCGNPVATAGIKEGERVLDLGSGGGLDVLLSAQKIGSEGRAIGLDMSTDMIALARKSAYRQGYSPPQVAFVQCSLTEPLPVKSDSVNCIISNCVINLLPLSGKGALFKEVYRVLKPGGRVVLDDIVAKKDLPDYIRNDLASIIGCIGGAIEIQTYKQLLADAGFQDAVFVDTKGDLNVYKWTKSAACCDSTPATSRQDARACCGPDAAEASPPGCSNVPTTTVAQHDMNEWVASYQIYALKNEPVNSDDSCVPLEPLLRWWDAYPPAIASAPKITAEALAALIRSRNEADRNLAVIDLRRDDHSGWKVTGSFQRPAQSFYDHLAEFHDEFGSKSKVVFYCSSSRGRAPRCAGWYQDFLKGISHETEGVRAQPEVLVLDGGIKGWLQKFPDAPNLVAAV